MNGIEITRKEWKERFQNTRIGNHMFLNHPSWVTVKDGNPVFTYRYYSDFGTGKEKGSVVYHEQEVIVTDWPHFKRKDFRQDLQFDSKRREILFSSPKTTSAINDLGAVGAGNSAKIADFSQRIGSLPVNKNNN